MTLRYKFELTYSKSFDLDAVVSTVEARVMFSPPDSNASLSGMVSARRMLASGEQIIDEGKTINVPYTTKKQPRPRSGTVFLVCKSSSARSLGPTGVDVIVILGAIQPRPVLITRCNQPVKLQVD